MRTPQLATSNHERMRELDLLASACLGHRLAVRNVDNCLYMLSAFMYFEAFCQSLAKVGAMQIATFTIIRLSWLSGSEKIVCRAHV